MNFHTHGHDECAISGEITICDFDGGYLFTAGYLGGGEVKARAWAHSGSGSYGEAWPMQKLLSSSKHIICMDLRVGVGNTMLLYATQVHCWHA